MKALEAVALITGKLSQRQGRTLISKFNIWGTRNSRWVFRPGLG